MRENYRNSIASIKKFPQFTTMNVIDGQAGLIICASLIFYSLTIDNILTIIILLILAGVTISLVVGQGGLIQRAKKSVVAYKHASEEEQTWLDDTDKEIAKYMTGEEGDLEKVTQGNGMIFIDYLNSTDVGYYFRENGELYSFSVTPNSYLDREFELTNIRNDIKEYEDNGYAYITNTNDLYEYNVVSQNYEKKGENVKKCLYNWVYITNSNEIYKYNYGSNKYERVGEAPDLKEYYVGEYLTNSNELYSYHHTSQQFEKVKNVKDIKKTDGFYCLTNSNELYVDKSFATVDSNNRETSYTIRYEKVGVATDLKEYYGGEYLTNTNELYGYNYDSNKYEKVAEAVELKEYHERRIFNKFK